MGITHFIPIISLKGSDTYRLAAQCPSSLRAIPESGARTRPCGGELGFVWLWRLRPVCRSSTIPTFINAVFPV